MQVKNKNIITATSISFSYKDNEILKNTSFTVKSDDFIAIIGPNGSGKTTLLKILLGLLEPTKGQVKLLVDRSRIGYVPQKYNVDENFPGTVEEILSNENQGMHKKIGIGKLMKKKFAELSGGQQQRVLIALALQRNPALLILDEPTSGVDIKAQQSFYELLRHLNKSGIAIIIVTHEVGVISSSVKEVLGISRKIGCIEKPAEIPKLLKEMYGEDFVQSHHHGKKHD